MKTYDEKNWDEVLNPDLEVGYVYPGQRYIGTKRVTLERTAELYPPGGLQHEVPMYEDCQLYHAYTEDELAAIQNPEVPTDVESRVTALEEELQAAKILLGVE